jgi:quercetin dioxygenase-like cupin family protein
MKILAEGPPARTERPATQILHDDTNARVVAFHLMPGQKVPPHHSNSTVLVHVLEGIGVFHGADASETLSAGSMAVFEPGETHAIDAVESSLRFVAVITPRPRSDRPGIQTTFSPGS